MSKVSRRGFLRSSGGGAVVAGATLASAALVQSPAVQASSTNATLDYPETALGRAKDLKPGKGVTFTYPDPSSPCLLVKLDTPVKGGVGPNRDIVAYSLLCTHMGCPVVFDPSTRNFRCPCHFSVFDADKQGQMVAGQATENLPRITLRHDSEDDTITATGVEGLIYGRQANTL